MVEANQSMGGRDWLTLTLLTESVASHQKEPRQIYRWLELGWKNDGEGCCDTSPYL